MLDRFLNFIREKELIQPNARLLLAVSGGVDSMVLADILLKSGFRVALAHCNYQLRGQDSDEDQILVEQFAQNHGISVHVKRVETKKIVEQSNSSVQMVARDVRYRFFEDLMQNHSYDQVLLAHNADDRVESLLINVLRGTGIRGLQGMPIKRGNYVRPLLFASKEDIRGYADENYVHFREDKSNLEIQYQRNWVRLRLLPLLKMRVPNVENELVEFCKRTEESLLESETYIESKLNGISTNGRECIFISELQKSKIPFTLMRELLNPRGFSSDQIFEVLKLLDSVSGSCVENQNIRVLKDRNTLLIQPKGELTPKPNLNFQLIERSSLNDLNVSANQLLVDAESVLVEKLVLRRWRKGDKFRPFGMNGWKKLSDFFVDQKLSVSDKENAWILTQKNDIIWVLGMRMDDRFKVTTKTQKVLRITFEA